MCVADVGLVKVRQVSWCYSRKMSDRLLVVQCLSAYFTKNETKAKRMLDSRSLPNCLIWLVTVLSLNAER